MVNCRTTTVPTTTCGAKKEYMNFRIVVTQDQKSIRSLQNKARKEAIESNRKILVPIIETVLLCPRQNIPLCGQRDFGRIVSEFSRNTQFRVRSGDEILRKHL